MSPFGWIKAVRACRIKMSAVDRAVLFTLASYANEDDGLTWPGTSTIAKGACLSARRVPDSIKRLIHAGAIEVVEALPGRSTVYRLTPDGASGSPPTERQGSDDEGGDGASGVHPTERQGSESPTSDGASGVPLTERPGTPDGASPEVSKKGPIEVSMDPESGSCRGSEPRPRARGPGPFTRTWSRVWAEHHAGAEPALDPARDGEALKASRDAFGGDLELFEAGVRAFWAHVQAGSAWRSRNGLVGPPEFAADVSKWVSLARARLAADQRPAPGAVPPTSSTMAPSTPDAAQAWEQLVEGFRARVGHQDAAIWLEGHGHPVDVAGGVLDVELGHLEVATWWLDQGYPVIAEQLGQPVRLLVDGVEPDLAEAS